MLNYRIRILISVEQEGLTQTWGIREHHVHSPKNRRGQMTQRKKVKVARRYLASVNDGVGGGEVGVGAVVNF